MMVGAATARAVAARKRRRLIPELSVALFMRLMTPQAKAEFEKKMARGAEG
jgi:hypothetical protein